jgi:membrane-bound ClpP family serine protease
MLETFFQSFGFFGALFIALLAFCAFIFWFAGIAGIADLPASRKKNIQLIVCIVFPPYPFFWVFYDINRERKRMKE